MPPPPAAANTMADTISSLVQRSSEIAGETYGTVLLSRHSPGLAARDLQNPTHTQQVTLGVIAAYVVVIAILWNVPYLKMILWPFKVHLFSFVKYNSR